MVLKKIGRYVIRDNIGQSLAYEAVAADTEEFFVLKVYPKSIMQDDPTLWKELTDATALHRRLPPHPNVVNYYDNLLSTKSIYFVYSHGGEKSLEEIAEYQSLAANEKKLTENQIGSIFRQMVAAVAHLHSKNIAHTCLALEHFCVDQSGRISLVCMDHLRDLSKSSSLTLWRKPSINPICIPPEVHEMWESEAAEFSMNTAIPTVDGYASDMWALGVALYCLIEGKSPFENWKDVYQADPPLRPSLSYDCKSTIFGLLSADPTERLTMAMLRKHPWIVNGDVESAGGGGGGGGAGSGGQKPNAMDWWMMSDEEGVSSPNEFDIRDGTEEFPLSPLSMTRQLGSAFFSAKVAEMKHEKAMEKQEAEGGSPLYLYQQTTINAPLILDMYGAGGGTSDNAPSSPRLAAQGQGFGSTQGNMMKSLRGGQPQSFFASNANIPNLNVNSNDVRGDTSTSPKGGRRNVEARHSSMLGLAPMTFGNSSSSAAFENAEPAYRFSGVGLPGRMSVSNSPAPLGGLHGGTNVPIFTPDGRCVYCGARKGGERGDNTAADSGGRSADRITTPDQYPYPEAGVFRTTRSARPPVPKWDPSTLQIVTSRRKSTFLPVL